MRGICGCLVFAGLIFLGAGRGWAIPAGVDPARIQKELRERIPNADGIPEVSPLSRNDEVLPSFDEVSEFIIQKIKLRGNTLFENEVKELV
jgi:hypothetical protein